MAIQNRRGAYANFDKTRMVAGEFAVVQSNDPNVTDGKSVYIAFGPNDVKRLATQEDVLEVIESTIMTSYSSATKTLTLTINSSE